MFMNEQVLTYAATLVAQGDIPILMAALESVLQRRQDLLERHTLLHPSPGDPSRVDAALTPLDAELSALLADLERLQPPEVSIPQ
jgi:hypothetical protein